MVAMLAGSSGSNTSNKKSLRDLQVDRISQERDVQRQEDERKMRVMMEVIAREQR